MGWKRGLIYGIGVDVVVIFFSEEHLTFQEVGFLIAIPLTIAALLWVTEELSLPRKTKKS